MDDLDAFEGPKEVISGVDENITQIEAACDVFSLANEYKTISETDVSANEQVIYLTLTNKFPPKIMRLTSSVIKELRLSLDQAFCETAVALGRTNAKGIYFLLVAAMTIWKEL